MLWFTDSESSETIVIIKQSIQYTILSLFVYNKVSTSAFLGLNSHTHART